ncbi:MAG: hypothetical protein U9R06_00050 [Patescibacteria group bacterium]|nr:hypothetical protein [Patescibacteria group bacterium]
MPKPKKNIIINKEPDSSSDKAQESPDSYVFINVENSSIAEFTQRPVPSEQEVEKFEKIIEDETKEEEIDESLNEIYQDDNGGMANVKKLEIKKRHGFLFWFFILVFFVGGIAASGYAVYHYFYLQPGSDATAVEFYIESEGEVIAGEEFFYTIHYKNSSNINMQNARISVNYPDNFIFFDCFPEHADAKNNIWEFDVIPAKNSGEIKIKGALVGSEGETEIAIADLIYTPQNFSSEFKKDATFTSIIKDTGIELDVDYISSVLVNENNEIKLKLRGKENYYLNNFRLTIEPQENLEFINSEEDSEDSGIVQFDVARPGVWQVNEILNEERYLPITLKFNNKISDIQNLPLVFEYARVNEISTTTEQIKYYKFYEEILNFEVMKSDLNLALIVNGRREDQGVDFGETMNFSIVYKNRGETDLKDVLIMVVLESDFLDSGSLVDNNNGRKKGNMISWSKEEIEDLAILGQNEEGIIDFSINVFELNEIDVTKDYQIKSYAQFSVGDKSEISETEDNRSNIIINKINSDLNLGEEVRYFSVDNIPVGTGPHPPKVGETTSYKVYWDLQNNLHELSDLTVKVKLPDYVSWGDKNQSTIGRIDYDNDSRTVSWNIGRMPVTVYRALAEFNIGVTPVDSDKNTIMVLLPGTAVNAIDSITEDNLEKITKAKTTKLEDDGIAVGDGIVD